MSNTHVTGNIQSDSLEKNEKCSDFWRILVYRDANRLKNSRLASFCADMFASHAFFAVDMSSGILRSRSETRLDNRCGT